MKKVAKTVYEFVRTNARAAAGDTVTVTFVEDGARRNVAYYAPGARYVVRAAPYSWAVLAFDADGAVRCVQGDDYVARVARDHVAAAAMAPAAPPPASVDYSDIDRRDFDDDEETGWGWKR